jgi:thioredoxin 1
MNNASPLLHLNEASIAHAIATSHERPVLVDFWAEWCGPCKAQGPLLDQVAATNGDRALVAKVDVDAAPDVAARFGIRSIPTLIVLRHGREAARFVGIQSPAVLNAALATAA